MYKAEFESKDFLRTEKDVLERIDFSSFDEPEKLREYFKEIVSYPVQKLVEELDLLNVGSPAKITGSQIDIVKELLSVRLGLGFEIHYMLDMMSEQLQLIENGFKELDGMKNHRHKVGEGHYSEKPAW